MDTATRAERFFREDCENFAFISTNSLTEKMCGEMTQSQYWRGGTTVKCSPTSTGDSTTTRTTQRLRSAGVFIDNTADEDDKLRNIQPSIC